MKEAPCITASHGGRWECDRPTIETNGGKIVKMAATVESIEISRRPEDVFTYVLEPLYYAEWDNSVVSG